MSTEITVPKLPESVADATLVAWHKKPGEAVARDENLADLETDKVVLEVPAPAAGVLKEIRIQDGTTVTSGQVLAIFEAGAAATAAPAAAAKPAAPAAAKEAPAPVLSPAAKRVVEEQGLDASKLAGTGKGGRVTKEDAVASTAQPAPRPARPAAPAPRLASGSRAEQRVPMSRLRARIAERLVQAQSTQALLTTFNEVDLHEVQELRARHKDKFEKKHGVKLGFSSFFVRATIEALKKFPVVNASVDGNDIVYHEFYDIGVAVSTERGLVVPVLRDADALSFADIEKGVGDFATRARSNALTMEDLTGGTFSITNGGVFGSLMSTPIVNAPQSAILGMHKIQDRPVVVNGQVAVRPMMYLALTYDHRIIDGKEAVQFLVAIKDSLEDPGRLLIGIEVAMSDSFDVIVIGGGPAGYPAAIRAAQNKLSVACIDGWQNLDGNYAFGGTCLNAGCIPSKALLESSELYHRAAHEFKAHGIGTGALSVDVATMQKRKAGIVKGMTGGIVALFKAAGVTALQGRGQLLPGRKVKFTAVDGTTRELSAKTVILASGSVPTPLKSAPLDGKLVVDSWGALEFAEVPKRLGVIGAGVIGLELGSVWARLGAKVTVLEAMDQFLSIADRQLATEALRQLQKQGLDIRLGAKVSAANVKGRAVAVSYTDAKGEQSIEFDRLVVAIGRRPYTEGLLAPGTGVEIDERGFVKVDDHCRAGADGVFAVGDCVRGPMLAHKAKDEGIMAAEMAAGRYGHVNYDVIPSVIYTAPEIAWVGLTEEQAKAKVAAVKTGVFPFIASGRARAMEAPAGFCKLVADATTDRVLGVHIIGPMAGELIAEAALALEYSASCEDLQRTIHAHPTLAEAVHEAASAADKRAIDTLNR